MTRIALKVMLPGLIISCLLTSNRLVVYGQEKVIPISGTLYLKKDNGTSQVLTNASISYVIYKKDGTKVPQSQSIGAQGKYYIRANRVEKVIFINAQQEIQRDGRAQIIDYNFVSSDLKQRQIVLAFRRLRTASPRIYNIKRGNILDETGQPFPQASIKIGDKPVNSVNSDGSFRGIFRLTQSTKLQVTTNTQNSIKFERVAYSEFGQEEDRASWQIQNNRIVIFLPLSHKPKKYKIYNVRERRYVEVLQNITVSLGTLSKSIPWSPTSKSFLSHITIHEGNLTLPWKYTLVNVVNEKINIVEAGGNTTNKAIKQENNELRRKLKASLAIIDSLGKRVKLLQEENKTISKKIEKQLLAKLDSAHKNAISIMQTISSNLIHKMLDNKNPLKKKLLENVSYQTPEQIDSLITKIKKNLDETQADLTKAQSEKEQYYIGLIASGISVLAVVTLFLTLYLRHKEQEANRANYHSTVIDILLTELNHRVKNNMIALQATVNQLARGLPVASNGNFEGAQASSGAYKHSLDIINQDIKKVLTLQEKLNYEVLLGNVGRNIQGEESYPNSKFKDTFEIMAYLTELSNDVIKLSYKKANVPIVDVQVHINRLSEREVIRLGFTNNELINNICKHAFTGKIASPKINIRLIEKGGLLKLTITDNGQGIPASFFDKKGQFKFGENTFSQGLRIIDYLTKKSQGSFKIYSEHVHKDKVTKGSKFVCTFKYLSKS